MASKRSAKAAQKIRMAAQEGYGIVPAATPAAEPDPAMYGIMAPAYARRLESMNDDIRGPLTDIALREGAVEEAKRYDAALKAGYLGQLGIEKAKGTAGTGKAIAERLGDLGKYGLIGAVTADDDGNIVVDPVSAMTSNAYSMNERQADVFKNNAAGIKDLRDANVEVDPNTVADMMTPPNQTNRQEGYGFIKNTTPVEETARFKAEADAENDRIRANAEATRAAKYQGGSDGSPTITVTPGMFPGMPSGVTIRGKGAAMEQYLPNNVPNGSPLSPRPNAPSKLQQRIAEAKALGATTTQQGSNTVITSKSGRSVVLNANGDVVR
jgi:hypothetical protein